MSQPPWETQIQPGWGADPQQQPPQQQPGPGGWNQGPYPPQQPQGAPQFPPYGGQQPQYPPPPSQAGGGGFPPQAPVFSQAAYADRQPYPDYAEPARKGNGNRTAGIVGAAVLVVAVGGTVAYLGTQHKGGDSKPTTTSAAAPTTSASAAGSSGAPVPDNAYPSSSASSAPGTTPPSTGASIPVPGGDSLNSAATDKTPFTQQALAAPHFKDSKSVVYTLAAAAPKPCDKVGDSVVTPIIKSAKCTQFMAASWTDSSGRIIVSAMIIPYPDAATAKRIEDKLAAAAHTGDYNQWCPPPGKPDADVCGKLTNTATREGKFGSFHRYLLITTAVYADLRNDDAQKDWLNAAADGAFQNTLPGQ